MIKNISIGKKVVIGERQPLTIIAGPCAIESEEHSLYIAGKIRQICLDLGIQYIFKSSFDKDCRSSCMSYRGIGRLNGLAILQKVKDCFDIPVTTDVSKVGDITNVIDVVDLLQIPAYLCRQTHLLEEAARAPAVSIKKGQFISPTNMINAAIKVKRMGNDNILLIDRGTMFGYNDLVSDMRCFSIMKQSGYPVCYDATHSIQKPGALETHSGGAREFIPDLTRAAVAAGANALFFEVHDSPAMALCDSKTQLPLYRLKSILSDANRIYNLVRKLDENNCCDTC